MANLEQMKKKVFTIIFHQQIAKNTQNNIEILHKILQKISKQCCEYTFIKNILRSGNNRCKVYFFVQ
jgi:hypothetical protein